MPAPGVPAAVVVNGTIYVLGSDYSAYSQSIHEHLLGTTTWHSKRVASDLGISALKYALDWNGYYGGPARLPLLPLTAELKAEVEQLMVDLRN